MNKQHFLEASADYFAGAFEMISDDLPDGAWFQMHVDIAEEIIDQVCEDMEIKRPKNIDGHDIAQHYLQS